MTDKLRYAGNYRALWGEGPIFYEGKLLYVDIEGKKVISYCPESDSESILDIGERVGTVVPRASGGMVIAGDSGFRFIDAGGKLSDIGDPEQAITENRFNDGKCDPSGRFWAGTISTSRIAGTASLYRLDADLQITRQLGNVTNSNGICWSRDGGTMFYIDTPRKEIWAFDFKDATGEISNRRTIIDTSSFAGSPDGMTIDADGHLWVAFCKGFAVRAFSPTTGKQVACIDMPAFCPTAPAFGGAGYRDLYITTGQHPDDQAPGAGRLYVTRPGAIGLPATAFSG
jgi:sugar lactone lactonase YvrE